jgi:excisionase family DNA binding protein
MDTKSTAQAGSGSANSLPRLTYKIKEAAAILGISTLTIRKEIRDGRIKAINRFRHVLIPADELTRWVEAAR